MKKKNETQLIRCNWCVGKPLYEHYHDNEWGIPVYNDSVLFEFLVLESAQAGLSWWTILQRRENYRKAFSQFEDASVFLILQSPQELEIQSKWFETNLTFSCQLLSFSFRLLSFSFLPYFSLFSNEGLRRIGGFHFCLFYPRSKSF